MIEFSFFVFAIVVSLFILFVLTKNDFVLLRKNVSQTHVFDIYIASAIFSYIFSRLFFIVDLAQYDYIHVLKFFYPTRFEGLSLLGFFIGGLFAITILYRGKSAYARMFDIVVISAYPVFSVFLLFHGFAGNVYIGSVLALLSIVIFFMSLRFHSRYTLKDGSISLIMLITICVAQFAYILQIDHKAILLSLSFTQLFSLVFGLLCLVLLVLNQLHAKR